jgi:hypothetical protein
LKRKTYYTIYLVDRPPTTAASVRKVRKILRQERFGDLDPIDLATALQGVHGYLQKV